MEKSQKGREAAGEPRDAATRALQTIDDVRRRLDDAGVGDDLAAIASEVHARLSAALETMEAAAAKVIEELAAVPGQVPRVVQGEIVEVERRIRRNPLGAVAVAAGLGLVVGLLLRRR